MQFYFYGTLGYAWFGRDNFRGIPLEDTQYTILAAAERRFRADQSFLIENLVTFDNSPDFGIHAGVVWRF